MRNLLLIFLLLTIPISTSKAFLKQHSKNLRAISKKTPRWKLRRAQRATQNAPDERRRPSHHDEDKSRCIATTKEIITAIGGLIALVITAIKLIGRKR